MSAVLDNVNLPSDVKALDRGQLDALCGELRERIIRTVSETGGHLGANLGVVELTVALLRVFDPPRDRIVWDVSHQTYAYKILTGRKDRFDTLRQIDGISGFLRRSESEYDAFGAGHSGTAISAALGMAVARDRGGGDEHVVAVLGDGAASCGISFEALNNVAQTTKRLIVILNDNEMSIAANVGSLSRSLGRLLANPGYNRLKSTVEKSAKRLHMGWLRNGYYRIEEAIKSLFLHSVIFEEFGLRYIGPLDGHNIPALLDALTIAKESDKPIVLHVSTLKGRGYEFAERQPEKWHGTPGFSVATGETCSTPGPPGYSNVFGQALERLAERDERIVAITAAMAAGTGLAGFAARFPDRFFDVGISEEHAAVFAAGLAADGLRPVFAVYSTFAQRLVDYVIHDVCLQNLPVVFCLDRAGVVGDDGPTHHGIFDLALFRTIPGLIMMQPKDEAELADMLYTALQAGHPAMIRYPRGAGRGVAVADEPSLLPVGRAEVLKQGVDVQLWVLGDMLALAEDVSERLAAAGVQAGVVNARFAKPLDEQLLLQQAAEASWVVTFENGVVNGGFGSAVEEVLSAGRCECNVLKVGWPNEFVPHGDLASLRERYGLTASAVTERILSAVNG